MRLLFAFLCFLSFCLPAMAQKSGAKKQKSWTGIASYYHTKFNGRKTASGAIFSNQKLTAANNFLKLGTRVRVTNLKTGKEVVVVINDRLHARNKRLIDLSQAAAKELGFFGKGLCKVRIEVVETSD